MLKDPASAWQASDFHYSLPTQLIAQQPLAQRSASRLLHLHRAQNTRISHCLFNDLRALIRAEDLLIFNNTKVVPARLKGRKSTGGQVECLLERILAHDRLLTQVRASKAPKPGTEVIIADAFRLKMLDRHDDLFEWQVMASQPILVLLEQYGSMPLPPYIERGVDAQDNERYQTVFATKEGAVAAPTAGLHFDQALLDDLTAQGVAMAEVTLHVGAGTFQPLRVDQIAQHKMHTEWMQLSPTVVEAIEACRQRQGRVIAVGTTVVRCLETAAKSGALKAYSGDTNLFIYPGFSFRVVDALITNFHLPCSTLLMLVSAFAGYKETMLAYQQAVAEKYRFFSYGDAMFIT